MRKIRKRSKLLPLAVIIFVYAVVVIASGLMNASAAGEIFTIKNVEAVEKSETIEIKDLSCEKSTVNSNVVFHRVGEYVKYKITIQNDEDRDYKIRAITDDNQNGCVTYEYSGWSDTEIKANNTAEFYITAKYSKEVENVANRAQNMDVKIDVQLEDEYGNSINKIITMNPKTGDNVAVYTSLLVVSSIVIIGFIIVNKKGKKSKKLFSILIVAVLATPAVAKAADSLLVVNFKSTVALEDKIVITYVDDLTGKTKSTVAKYGESVAVAAAPEEEPDDFLEWVDESGKAVAKNFVATKDVTIYAKRKSDEDYERDGLVFTLAEDDTYTVADYTGDALVVRIPAKYKGKAVTTIGENAFRASEITNIFLPNSLTTIEDEAFRGCYDLESIDIPDSVTTLGSGIFFECESLESVSLSKNGTYIGDTMFSECIALLSIEIPNSVTSIGRLAFFDCGITSCSVGEGVETIGIAAFLGCDCLTSIEIPDNVERIEDSAFSGCSDLASVSIGKNVKYIGTQAFLECSDLASISIDSENQYYYVANNCILTTADNVLISAGKNSSIPNNTTCIKSYAFCGTNIVSVTMPDSLTTIERGAFSECQDLTSVTIGKNVSSIEGALFADCDKLETVTVDADNSVYYSYGNCIITRDDKTVIAGCNNSELPNDVTCIGCEAFAYCNLIDFLRIPATVTSIEEEAFYRCRALNQILFEGTDEQWENIEKGVLWVIDESDVIVYTDSTKFTYTLLENDTYEITGYTGTDYMAVVPMEHNGKTVTSIGANTFRCQLAIVVPCTITHIEENAIYCDIACGVLYPGTEAEWANIVKDDNWIDVPNGNWKVFCSDSPREMA